MYKDMKLGSQRKLCFDKRYVQIFFMFFVILIFDVLIIRMEYQNYQEKVRILCLMLSEEEPIHSATKLLKGDTDGDVKVGVEILERYGYDLTKHNMLYQQYKTNVIKILVVSTVILLVSVCTILSAHKLERKKRKGQIQQLESIIAAYRNQVFEVQLSYSFDTNNKEFISLYSEVQSLGQYLNLLSEQVHREKEETKSLVTDISHQLKNPVAALKTSMELLEQDDLEEAQKQEFISRCKYQLRGIEHLLVALINISRLETGIIEIRKESTYIFETILDAVNRVYAKAEQKEIKIELEGEEECQEFMLPHDKKWLCEAFINLLDNAIKYSKDQTSIIIRILKRVTILRIEIQDQGIGIQRSEYNQIFKRFYRGHSKEVKEQTGSGVGLFLTREIIHRHHGTIHVSAGENEVGSKFIIQLPYES